MRAAFQNPPYVTEALIDTLSSHLGADFVLADFACQHMVAQVKPAETAAVIRDMLG